MNHPQTYATSFDSPVGKLYAQARQNSITVLHMVGAQHPPKMLADIIDSPELPIFLQLQTQLFEYFAGRRREFKLSLAPDGTAFEKSVWRALLKIPYGETCTYGQQALRINNPNAVRAVGAANGRNPIGIIIPCHRVIGRSGTLTGYAGGLDKKAFLLRLENDSSEKAPNALC
jgi:methylated-DNA-[protein]-cysteine S-methyltransferase